MTNNTKATIENPIQKINDFLRLIGLSDEKISDHHQRLNKLIFSSIADDLDKLSALKDKKPFPSDLKSVDDFFNYYEKYVAKEHVAKIVQEKYYKFYSGYISAMDKKLKELDNI